LHNEEKGLATSNWMSSGANMQAVSKR